MSWSKFWFFAGGVAATCMAQGAAQSKQVRDATVHGVAKCMEFGDCVQSTAQNIVDDASDIKEEAQRQKRIDAAVAERLAMAEDDIREEVRSEAERLHGDDKASREMPVDKKISKSKK